MLHKIRKFKALARTEKKLFIEAFIKLGIMRLAVLTRSFKRLVDHLQQYQSMTEATALTEKEDIIAQSIGRAIHRAANVTPWESACLVQALAAQRILQKRNIPGAFYLGAMKDEQVNEVIKAHAWLQCGGITITGGGGSEAFTVLSEFKWGRR